MKHISLFLLIMSLILSPLQANAEMTLEAEEKIEWYQDDNKIIAIGKAVAIKDNTTMKSEIMTGFYDKNETNNQTEITKLIAEKKVVITTPTMTAYGNKFDYDALKDEAILYGNPAIIKTENSTINADDGIRYFPSQNKAVSFGKVKLDDKKNIVYSDKMTAYFLDNNNKKELDKVDLHQNVKIISDDTTVTSSRGEYFAKEDVAKLYENVVINKNGNIVRGDLGETNMATGISKLLPSKKGGRVSGVFTESNKKE